MKLLFLVFLALAAAPCGRASEADQPVPTAIAACLRQPDVPSDARALRDAVVSKYGETLLIEVDESLKLIFATGVDRETLDELRARIAAHARVLRRELFPEPRETYLAVVIPGEWRGTARGFFLMGEDTVLLKDPSGAVMHHEFTHAAHIADQQARGQVLHQNWIIEGLATLFEQYEEGEEGRLRILPNHRQRIIQNLVQRGAHKPWPTYVQFTQREFMREPGNHYSQGRYMFAYLYEMGLLKSWYDAYVEGYAEDPTGGAALEKVFGKALPEIEKDWVAWLLRLSAEGISPPGPPQGE